MDRNKEWGGKLGVDVPGSYTHTHSERERGRIESIVLLCMR